MSDPLPTGFPVEGWTPRPLPPCTPMHGRFCRVEPLDIEKHAADLHDANRDDPAGRNWTYLSSEPFRELDPYREYLRGIHDWRMCRS